MHTMKISCLQVSQARVIISFSDGNHSTTNINDSAYAPRTLTTVYGKFWQKKSGALLIFVTLPVHRTNILYVLRLSPMLSARLIDYLAIRPLFRCLQKVLRSLRPNAPYKISFTVSAPSLSPLFWALVTLLDTPSRSSHATLAADQ
jgi:hypothetical protein